MPFLPFGVWSGNEVAATRGFECEPRCLTVQEFFVPLALCILYVFNDLVYVFRFSLSAMCGVCLM
jgi:hypothetical protein